MTFGRKRKYGKMSVGGTYRLPNIQRNPTNIDKAPLDNIRSLTTMLKKLEDTSVPLSMNEELGFNELFRTTFPSKAPVRTKVGKTKVAIEPKKTKLLSFTWEAMEPTNNARKSTPKLKSNNNNNDDEEPNAESFFEGILFAETTDSSDGNKKNTSYLTEQTFDSDDTKNVSSENKKWVPSYCLTCPPRGMLLLLVAVFVSLLMVILHATGAITVATAEKAVTAVTAAPTISSAPSDAPSISSIPSFQPSESPSKSMTPTDEPTNRPSSSPTSTMAPSDAPSPSPSISWQPTVTPISSSKSFKLRLYWERGYFWQEESEETFWCVECTRCKERGRVS